MIAVSSLLSHLRVHAQHLAGWAFGGIGAGIALSGVLVFILRSAGSWRSAWWAAAALAVVCAVAAWALTPEPSPTATPSGPGGHGRPRTGRWFTAAFVSYFLEGIGYIIAGTFLVAAIDHTAGGWVGSGSWIVVGLAALPSCAVWAWLGRRWPQPTLLLVALLIQAVGIALPAVIAGVGPALISAFLFGATFLGVGSMALGIGARLQFPRAVTLLTTGYSVGQILGPLVVTPLLHDGYYHALLVGATIVLAAALAAAALRLRFPDHVGVMHAPSHSNNQHAETQPDSSVEWAHCPVVPPAQHLRGEGVHPERRSSAGVFSSTRHPEVGRHSRPRCAGGDRRSIQCSQVMSWEESLSAANSPKLCHSPGSSGGFDFALEMVVALERVAVGKCDAVASASAPDRAGIDAEGVDGHRVSNYSLIDKTS